MNLNLPLLKEKARKYKRLHNCSHSDALDVIATHIGADNWHDLISLSKRQTRLGFSELDRALGPLADDDLVLIAGRPSSGKTSFAVNCANNASTATLLPVIYCSMSEPEDHLRTLLIASQEKISVSDAARATHPTILSSISLTSKLVQSYHQVLVPNTPVLTPDEIAQYCRNIIADRGGISLLVIDSLEIMGFAGHETHDPAARTIGINRTIGELKQIAVELRVPIMVLANLQRHVVEGREDKRPLITDLRYPKIHEVSDKTILVYRDVIYNEDANPTAAEFTVITKANPNKRVIDMKYNHECRLFSGYPKGQ